MSRFLTWWHSRPKNTRIGAAIGAVLAFVILLAALVPAIDEGNGKTASSTPPPAAKNDAPPTAPDLPTLTATERESAVTIAASDPRVGPLLENPGVRRTVVPWMTTGAHRLLGAGIDVSWPTPINVSGEWPVLFYDQTESEVPPYLTTTARVKVSNLTAVHLAIDLEKHRVLGVEALPD